MERRLNESERPPELPRQVLECASPLALSVVHEVQKRQRTGALQNLAAHRLVSGG